MRNELASSYDEIRDYAKVLDCLYDIMSLMGAPYCFNKGNMDISDDLKNSPDIINLWA